MELDPRQVHSISQGLPYNYRSLMNIYMFMRVGQEQVESQGGAVPFKKRSINVKVDQPSTLDFLHINFLYCEGLEIKPIKIYITVV